MVGPHREGTPALAGAQGPSALMYELLLLDRGRGEYQHTLALIALLTALSRPGAGALTVAEGLRLLHELGVDDELYTASDVQCSA